MSLLAQGNHRMCELMWFTPPTSFFYSTNAWEELKKSVSFLTAHSLKHYHGIARGSMENLAPAGNKKKRRGGGKGERDFSTPSTRWKGMGEGWYVS
jgi:hypothetical protein